MNSAYVATYTTGYAPAASDNSAAAEYYRLIQEITARGATSATAFGSTGETCATAPQGSYIINTRTARYQAYDAAKLTEAASYAQVVYNNDNTLNASQGMWIEAVRAAPSGGTSYTDFHIRACWGGPGTDVPMNLGTIVRLYDPTN